MHNSLSSTEIGEKIKACHDRGRKAIAFVAIGCTEQHGPFLPIETDTIIAEHVSRHLAEAVNDKFWGHVFPPFSYTPTKSNADYPGTVSVDEDVFRQYLKQVCGGILRSSFDALVLVSGHGPADPSLAEISFNLVWEQYHNKNPVIKPVLVLSLLECNVLLEQKLKQKTGQHADWRELLYLVYILGNDYFDEKRVNDIMDFQRSNSFPMIKSPVLGMPMQLRSVQGVVGDPAPMPREAWAGMAVTVWDESIRHLTAALKEKLNAFWKKEGLAC